MAGGRFEATYLALLRFGELARRAQLAREHLSACDICAMECKANRLAGETGACRTGESALVSSYGPHHGEEDPLRGTGGSGTIFFTWCNLKCQYCQNYDISQEGHGRKVGPEEIASMMLSLQVQGCHNINLVSPSHVVPQIIAAVLVAAEAGLTLPLVYNTGGYDSPVALRLLDGIVDIYMPDMKYADADVARRLSKIPDYPQVNRAAVKEMHRQVGDLVMDEEGVAQRGLLIRHLVLPNGLAGTKAVVEFLAQEISPDTYINVMDQYHPAYRAAEYPELNRPLSSGEYAEALRLAQAAGLACLDERRPRRFILPL